jgi:hypothetical protein
MTVQPYWEMLESVFEERGRKWLIVEHHNCMGKVKKFDVNDSIALSIPAPIPKSRSIPSLPVPSL